MDILLIIGIAPVLILTCFVLSNTWQWGEAPIWLLIFGGYPAFVFAWMFILFIVLHFLGAETATNKLFNFSTKERAPRGGYKIPKELADKLSFLSEGWLAPSIGYKPFSESDLVKSETVSQRSLRQRDDSLVEGVWWSIFPEHQPVR